MDTIPEELIILIIKAVPEISFTLSLLNRKFNRICADQTFWSNLLKEKFDIDSGDDTACHYMRRHWRLNRFIECNNLCLRLIIIILLHKGANIEAKGYNGWTPLHRIARYGYDTFAKKLIEKGANIEAKCYNGRTPLYYAARYGHDKVVSKG